MLRSDLNKASRHVALLMACDSPHFLLPVSDKDAHTASITVVEASRCLFPLLPRLPSTRVDSFLLTALNPVIVIVGRT
ncbi:hypothetical protein E2C01_048596 [Portunus trituberculatus]|uniref:Uncharacterized protein n=1 Tax=Portunus trituberculatus TaxID=210409 RepID=A0A5B7G6V4_PORTR|nr:hypothetical protein [Portunus trituberculatus]